MSEYLKSKIKEKAILYFINALGAMAYGLFATLLVGTILNTIGNSFNISFLSEVLWPLAQQATGPAIAVAIAFALGAPSLVVFSATVVGIAGNELGGPMGVYIATIFAVEFGKIVSGKTKIDIIVTPTVTVLIGVFVATFVGPYIQAFMNFLGAIIINATNRAPFVMGIIVSVIVGIVLTLPISSAALSMMLSLSSLAGGAATIGCCCQMIGFAVISYRDNGMEGLAAQGLGTSMLQMPNIVKNPMILVPPTLASAILGPLSTMVFKLENTPLGSGMGTSGLVGQISTFNAMPDVPFKKLFPIVLLMHIVLPAIVSYIIYYFMRKKDLIKDGDMKLSFTK
ncbi:PTS transporter subunit IIC [Peptoniphilus sp.]|uniref:PTS transporter subunit IIC n=1 Tax=Peptoniphilus sp. TaxID=1971214 RepID=UPI003D8F6ABC